MSARVTHNLCCNLRNRGIGAFRLFNYSNGRSRETMILPDSKRAYIDRAKITDYLLSTSHPDGRGKALFFKRFGFRIEEWRVLADALRTIGVSNPVSGVVESPYGRRYTVDGPLQSPDGRMPTVRTVWIVESERPPRLITAYPV